MKLTFSITTLLLLFVQSLSVGQADTIKLRKPSFEQPPQAGRSADLGIAATNIVGWSDCGRIYHPKESPPDIHPINFWGNTKQAYDGNTYLGMVTRDNESWESVSQRMSSEMIAGECYSFTVYLSKSERYLSLSRMRADDKEVNYTRPIVLRIWGGSNYCGTQQLIGETSAVDHSQWKSYVFKFKPTANVSHITFEAFYKTPVTIPYNGHILIDNMSAIVKVDCDAPEVEIASAEKPTVPPHKRTKKLKPKPEPEPEPAAKTSSSGAAATPKKKILTSLNRAEIKEGQTIEIENLYFKADTTSINADSYEVLDEVYEFLRGNEDVIIEIGGHTNGTPSHAYCDKLSSERAKEVATYLVQKGIEPSKLKYKGYGKRKPVASNFTPSGRKKNQRVEIKILKIGK